MLVDYRLKIFTVCTQRYTITKGWHEAVCLPKVMPIRQKLQSPYEFENNENRNKFEKKIESHDKDEWGIQ